MYSQTVLAVEEYRQRLKDRESRFAHYEKLHIRLGNIRLALAAAAAWMAWESIGRHAFSYWWIAVPAFVFASVVAYHSRVLRARAMTQRGAFFYRIGIARIEDRWVGTGQTGDRFHDPHHVYAADLDLFGRGSLFELLSTARTRMGEETLAKWLLSPSEVNQIEERHAAIDELRDQLDLREDLAILGEDASVSVYPEALLGWAEGPNQLNPPWLQWLVPILVLAAVVGAVAWGYFGIATPFLLIVLIEAIMGYRLRKPREEVLHGSEKAFRHLDVLSGILARIEQHTFRAPRLQSLQGELSSYQLEGSRAIARLRTIVDLIDSRDNVIVRILDVPLMYSVHVALAAERWRRAHGHAVRSWLSVIGEIEALICLATYSYEHPDDSFPDFVQGSACFEATGIGHPLIPAAICIRNDVCLSDGRRVFLVSGSNMSGKSTLLRAIGLNTVLALAGAPVCAVSLRLSRLSVCASLSVVDSLLNGKSKFMAEVDRLRQTLEAAAAGSPVLFLIDEILSGTNSRDRRVAAEALVRTLVNRGAIGALSTHDLAISEIATLEELHGANVHMGSKDGGGPMDFDYLLKPGVTTEANALAIARMAGVPV